MGRRTVGQDVGLDTAQLTYFIEQRQPYLDALRLFFAAVDDGKIQVVTSA